MCKHRILDHTLGGVWPGDDARVRGTHSVCSDVCHMHLSGTLVAYRQKCQVHWWHTVRSAITILYCNCLMKITKVRLKRCKQRCLPLSNKSITKCQICSTRDLLKFVLSNNKPHTTFFSFYHQNYLISKKNHYG